MSAVCNLAAMRDRDKADLRASNPRVRTTGTRTRSPDAKCAPANHGRERSARDWNSRLASTTASWPSAKKGAALGRDQGRDARPHAFATALLCAPRATVWVFVVWCVPMNADSPGPNTKAWRADGRALAAPHHGAGRRGPRGSESVLAARDGLGCEGEARRLTQRAHANDGTHLAGWERMLGG